MVTDGKCLKGHSLPYPKFRDAIASKNELHICGGV